MSPDGISLSGFVAPRQPTLQDVLERIVASGLPKASKRNMISALNAVAKVTGKPLSRFPADVARIREVLERKDWGATGYSKRNWSNIRSSVRRAIEESGLVPGRVATRVPLSPRWQDLVDTIRVTQAKSNLKRLGHFCSAHQISPEDVTDRTVEAFLTHLDEQELCKTPEQIVRTTIADWNRHAVPALGVARLSTRGQRKIYILPWTAFPSSLEIDAVSYRTTTTGGNFLDRTRPVVRQSTADKRHRMIRQFASVLVLAGDDPHDLSDLKAVFAVDRVKRGLAHLVERNAGNTNQQAFNMACMAKTIAESWCGMDQAGVDQIAAWSRKLKPDKQGLTDKNKERLAPFADQEVMRRFLGLPCRLAARAGGMERGYRAAMLMQSAVAIALLQHAPLRILNLASLHWDRHFLHQMTASKAPVVLSIAGKEVKNSAELTFPLPTEVVELLRIYRSDYLHLVNDAYGLSDGMFLFPGRSGGTKPESYKTENSMRRMIMRTIDREMGLIVNPHLFRHLCAQIILTAHPGQYETVRRMLGHKSIQTTIQAYVGFEMSAASEQYNAVLAKLTGRSTS
ncbi:MAG: site-specific integrase [Alphaproteobacteria bacterium]|nr:site-specific integrase [Alphaproteobacteria bacterium]